MDPLRLQQRVWQLEEELRRHGLPVPQGPAEVEPVVPDELPPLSPVVHLSHAHIERYSRQLLIPAVGPRAQRLITSRSVLVVGAGGLGCPVIAYLAGAGVGRIGVVDSDVVEASNLHRQVLHQEASCGLPKAVSACREARARNSMVHCVPICERFTAANALHLTSSFDVVVDATDNMATRYLISDACVMTGRPLVSGAALGLDGQLSVFVHKGGPCYRCRNPVPPPPHTMTSCADGGVLGPVPGVIGCLQAIEALKIVGEFGAPLTERMLVLDAADGRVRIVRMPGRRPDCAVCGDAEHRTIGSVEDSHEFNVRHGLVASEGASCVAQRAVVSQLAGLEPEECVTPQEYSALLAAGAPHLLLDVREQHQFEIVALPHAVNLPLKELRRDTGRVRELRRGADGTELPVFVMCRRGILSQLAAQSLREAGVAGVKHVEGGLERWAAEVDTSVPKY